MLGEFRERLSDTWERYRKTADFDFGATPDDLQRHYEIGDEEMQKNAALYSLQLAFDAAADDEIEEELYEEIRDRAFEHVESFYFDEDHDLDLTVPDIEASTTEFRYHGYEEEFVERYVDEEFDDVDEVVAVASSGMEPGMVAASMHDLPYSIVRYSHRRLDDDAVTDFDPGYDGTVALVDDEAYTGRTITAVRRYLEQHGAEVREEPFRDTRDEGLLDRDIVHDLKDALLG
ncbi:MAG: phosphoribosyltransferase [Candidatus Nanohaloarchaea archaeon]|nr:phosphoribosyltransferase [Candidatus Nanohaloarchaea archaeon]